VVIEGKDPIVEAQGEVGDLELIVARPGQPFQMMAQVVSPQARGSSLKGRETGKGVGLPASQLFGEDREGIVELRIANCELRI
jgi:hypothetical protein